MTKKDKRGGLIDPARGERVGGRMRSYTKSRSLKRLLSVGEVFHYPYSSPTEPEARQLVPVAAARLRDHMVLDKELEAGKEVGEEKKTNRHVRIII